MRQMINNDEIANILKSLSISIDKKLIFFEAIRVRTIKNAQCRQCIKAEILLSPIVIATSSLKHFFECQKIKKIV